MRVISFCLGRLRRRDGAVRDAGGPAGEAARSRGAVRDCEPPLSLSELMAASSFLDFGGMLDERWLCGRYPEDGGGRRRR
jgi:hypothetical protein